VIAMVPQRLHCLGTHERGRRRTGAREERRRAALMSDDASSSNSAAPPLHEPLLNQRRPWDEEYTHNNGRGRGALTAFLLGIGAGASLLPLVTFPAAMPFFAYLILLICFHFSEYALTAAFRPDTLSFDNFLLNHSPAYQVMVVVCWLEYWVCLPPARPG
jgi:hypothetical protein